MSKPGWYTARGGFNLGSFGRSLGRFSAGAKRAIMTSRRGGDGSWSGGGGLSGGASGGGMGGGGGGTF